MNVRLGRVQVQVPPLLPGRQQVLVVAPLVVAGAILLPRARGPCGQHLVVEVTPAHLPHERVDPRAPPVGPVDELEWGQAPEVQTRRQPRGGGRHQIGALAVPGDLAVVQPRLHAAAGNGLAPLGQVRGDLAGSELVAAWETSAYVDAAWEPQPRGRADRVPGTDALPPAPVRGEHVEVVARGGSDLGTRLDWVAGTLRRRSRRPARNSGTTRAACAAAAARAGWSWIRKSRVKSTTAVSMPRGLPVRREPHATHDTPTAEGSLRGKSAA